jgi:hypothetical protein
VGTDGRIILKRTLKVFVCVRVCVGRAQWRALADTATNLQAGQKCARLLTDRATVRRPRYGAVSGQMFAAEAHLSNSS